ncbi:hypothetical protein MMC27_002436 [Xylographa pallens]|nr:hypothetical protein [Xylographa pallens]
MKPRGPQGRIFTFLPTSECDAHILSSVFLPDGVRGHMVIPISGVKQRGWVSIVTITSSLPASGLTCQYVPIWPGKAPAHSGLHIKLCNCWGFWATQLRKRSYVRLDQVYDVPLKILRQVDPNLDGSSLEVQQESFEKMIKRIEWLRNDGLSTNWPTQAAAAAPQI